MAFVNIYTPPSTSAPPSTSWDPDPWDINFVFPIPPTMENAVVRLTPLVPRLHLDAFWEVGASDITLYQQMGLRPKRKEALLGHLLDGQQDPGRCTFLVVDKTKSEAEGQGHVGGVMAGMISYLHTSAEHRVRLSFPLSSGWNSYSSQATEIGVVILKSAQGTHVATNAIGLLLHYALNLPSDQASPGLGLRRVQWRCTPANAPSLRAAQRLGFQLEGVMRWTWVAGNESEGSEPTRAGDPVGYNGGHDAFLSMCWDQWVKEGRTVVEKQMARTALHTFNLPVNGSLHAFSVRRRSRGRAAL
jgi:RimJ/RimL family protein N-acetyltransferase